MKCIIYESVHTQILWDTTRSATSQVTRKLGKRPTLSLERVGKVWKVYKEPSLKWTKYLCRVH